MFDQIFELERQLEPLNNRAFFIEHPQNRQELTIEDLTGPIRINIEYVLHRENHELPVLLKIISLFFHRARQLIRLHLLFFHHPFIVPFKLIQKSLLKI